ncbi:MAG: ABC transporter ATP-binding protein [Mucinivorans sp.]
MSSVIVENIAKKYGKVDALCGVSFVVPKGEIFGIIGADGAGKTTLFRILTTLLLADSGTASVEGLDVVKQYRDIRSQVGYMPGRFSLYQDMTVEENLAFFATLFGTTIKENYYLIEDIYKQIEPFKDRRAGKLSGGMKQKLALCSALIHCPTVLFLDEPTTGVDPVSRKEFWTMLRRLKDRGITILVSTPYMDEATLCDRIGLIADGRFLMIDTPQAIVDSFDKPLYAVSGDRMPQLLRDIRANQTVESCYAFGDVHHVTLDVEINLQEYLESCGHQNVVVRPIVASVEDCFMKLNK